MRDQTLHYAKCWTSLREKAPPGNLLLYLNGKENYTFHPHPVRSVYTPRVKVDVRLTQTSTCGYKAASLRKCQRVLERICANAVTIKVTVTGVIFYGNRVTVFMKLILGQTTISRGTTSPHLSHNNDVSQKNKKYV